ncbi:MULTISPECIES: DUF305 domain-containing protein [unclassified Paracoccus (in: a-proteobacteria)]|uniref:CopM family metallochaperone n=1 Tax=Paracoccus TaxID=265 RepID=UPI000CCFF476|nr:MULTISPECIES: DUF305 domain-containing protein [unclassified Paracoccus (in: a-proteobacteria)]MDQ1901971.1 DUF305 domain-containing protein [Paracoccus sp. WLY502]
MTYVKTLAALAIAVTTVSNPLFAQEAEFKLPEQCAASTSSDQMPSSGMHGSSMASSDQADGMGSGMMGMGGMKMEDMPEHVQDNMRKMMATMPAMHQGMMNEDADVAFACGMIAHHQGAIDMAEVLLEHGKNEQMRALAEEIITAQVGEIELMTTWLSENAK